jgi:hypothetical protein
MSKKCLGLATTKPVYTKALEAKFTFTADDVINRSRVSEIGPELKGIGIAQWTFGKRRPGLFAHSFNGGPLGPSILYNVEAQLDYLVWKLKNSDKKFRDLYDKVLMNNSVTLEFASEEFLRKFENPGVFQTGTAKAQKKEVDERIKYSNDALTAYISFKTAWEF